MRYRCLATRLSSLFRLSTRESYSGQFCLFEKSTLNLLARAQASTQTQIHTSFNSDPLQLSSIETQTLQSLGLSRSTTETQTLLDELEKTLADSISTQQTFPDPLGESTSTQTFDSFLSSNNSLMNDSLGTSQETTNRDDTSTVTGTHFTPQSQNETFNPSFSHDPVMGSSSSHVTNMGHFGVQTDESPLSNFLSSSVQMSLFDDTTAFTSIETQTVDDSVSSSC